MPHKDKQVRREYSRVRNLAMTHRRKAEVFDGQACAHCGTGDDLRLVHEDLATKTTQALWYWPQERRDEFIASCQFLCVRCRKVHNFNRTPVPHGALLGYVKFKCRCEPCRDWKRSTR